MIGPERMLGPAPGRPRPALVLALLLALLAVAMVVGATSGSVAIRPAALARMVLNRLGLAHFAPTWRPQDEVIFFSLRLPRVAGAALAGLALATSGTLFQGLLCNPLADPYVVGTSGGASLGAVLGIMLSARVRLLGFGLVPLLAFAGGLAAVALVYGLATSGGRTPLVTMLLAGLAVSTVLSYTVSLLLLINDRLQLNLPGLYSWLLGGVSVQQWSQLAVVGPVVLLTAGAAWGLARSLNALALGEEMAARLGVPVERVKRSAILAGALLTGAAVTISGLIGFVGLVVPHILRLLCGPDHRLLLPAAGIGGAVFLVVADLLARVLLAPAEMPVGILTAFLGGPYFIYLLRLQRRGYAL